MPEVSIIEKEKMLECVRIDPEFFSPQYTALYSKLSTIDTEPLERIAHVTDGNHLSIAEAFVDKGVRYLRGQDVSELFIEDHEPVFIPDDIYQKLKRSHIKKNDIVLSIVGTIGNLAIVSQDIEKLTANCKLAIIRTYSMEPEYLYAYLASKYGQTQIKRNIRGTVQKGLILPDLKKILIAILSNEIREKVKSMVNIAHNKKRESIESFKKAEHLFAEKIGLKDVKATNEVVYYKLSSDIEKTHRMDAEFFNPKCDYILEVAGKSSELVRLENLSQFVKGIEVGSEEYGEEGIPFIRVSNLTKFGLNSHDQKYVSPQLYEKLKLRFQPHIGEVLLSKDATPGIALGIDEERDIILSSGILRLKLKEYEGEEVEPDYIAIALNSIVVQSQIERDLGGSVIFHWRPEQIKNVMIPILPKFERQKIVKFLEDFRQKKVEAKQILEEAIELIERNIEVRAGNH